MKYVLIALGFVLLALAVLMMFSSVGTYAVPGALLTIASAILMAAGSMLDRIDRRL